MLWIVGLFLQQTTAEATLWAFCHVLSQSIRMGDVYVACTGMP